MGDDERIESCVSCGDEACFCHLICQECKEWKTSCSCPTEPVLAHYCKDCGETGEAVLEVDRVDGESVVFPLCGDCGSDNVTHVDDVIDSVEHAKGDR